MILANLRERLTSADFELVVERLARREPTRRAEFERLRQSGERERMLNEPGLLELLRTAPGLAAPSPPLFLYAAARTVLRGAGVDDARLSDYLGALLLEFGLRDRARRIAPHDDHVYGSLLEIVAELASAPGRRGFLLRVHLGNASLWLAGLFPDYITARRVRKGGPDLDYYDDLGARGFRLASRHAVARELDLADVYARAAESFARLRVALNRLSDRLFLPRHPSPDRLMRQVGDAFRFPEAETC